MRGFMQRLSAATLAVVLAAALPAAATTPEKVLIVVSGEGRDGGKMRPGYEFDEFSQAWLIFRDNGLRVEVASPQGGAVEADRFNPAEPFNARVLADPEATKMLAATRGTRELRAEDYAAVYVVGGKGAMFDLPKDLALRTLLADVYERGGIVAAVCHGPAALADVRLSDGSLLVAGRSLTGFSNEEEAFFGKQWVKEFPYLLEDAMRERGARWQEAPLMMPKLVVDGRLITGQNPYSTTAVAEAIVRATGRTPIAREPWREEATAALVQRHLAGETEASARALAGDRDRYHVELIAAFGYYHSKAAQDEAAVRSALSVLALASPYMDAPQLKLAQAEAHLKLGERTQARALLEKVLAAKPDMAEARQLMERIDG